MSYYPRQGARMRMEDRPPCPESRDRPAYVGTVEIGTLLAFNRYREDVVLVQLNDAGEALLKEGKLGPGATIYTMHTRPQQEPAP